MHEMNLRWEALRMARKRDAAKKNYFFKVIKSPIGALKLVASDGGLAAILWEKEDPRRVRLNIVGEHRNHPMLLEAERQLGEYFSGQRQGFDLRLDFAGTEFQRKVWAALLAIPFGETRSYGEIARQLGNPGAMRAVGAAIGKNPIAIVAPCHRVIGSRGDLTGFAGGLKAKAHLLGLERSASQPSGKDDMGPVPASRETAGVIFGAP
jgi:methylated-DNA-[protein]-cysteine S-methyltransferase